MDENEAIGTDSAVTLVRQEEGVIQDKERDKQKDVKVRGGWDNKVQYILAQIGFAVGLGNVWRFPYLCQKNGGGAFLIPYFTMMILEGIPLFFLEIAIGQRLKRGSVGVWNHIHPLLGGVGIASMIICFYIAVYYNMIIAWALFYLFNSFQSVLPWSDCPEIKPENEFGLNLTEPYVLPECKLGTTSYFWYREALNVSESIDEPGSLVWRMVVCLLVAWVIVFAGMFNGIKSSGKVIYFSATFPYLVLLIFFVRGITLPGAIDGLAYMFTPDLTKLYNPNVWRDAATQIFFSLGLGFGGVIAYSSYNDVKNDCKRDALTVSLVNSGTSIFSCLVIFSILGFKAHDKSRICANENVDKAIQFWDMNHLTVADYGIDPRDIGQNNYTELFGELNQTIYNDPEFNTTWSHLKLGICTIEEELKDAVSGPGLAFIAFTEAMIKMPGAPFWSIMFFSMLINLGLGSMFGTVEGILTPLKDLGIKISKQLMIFIIAISCFLIGLLFCLESGMYMLGLFDTYAGTLPLLLVAFFENIAVIYVYGFNRFSEDIEYMTGSKPGLYWRITWCFISPVCMLVLFVASLVNLFIEAPKYDAYDNMTGSDSNTVAYPAWAVVVLVLLILSSIIWIPTMALLRKFKCVRYLATDGASRQHPTHNDY